MRMVVAAAFVATGCNLVFEALPENRSPCVGQTDLVLCLDFEDPLDDGLATDRSPTAADAVVEPPVAQVSRGVDNLAVHLAGGGALEVPFTPVLDVADTLTFELLVQLDAVGTMETPILLDHAPAYLITILPDGRARCAVDGDIDIESDEPLTTRPHRITCVKSTKLSMFIDGDAQNATVSAENPIVPPQRPTRIGSGRAGSPLTGLVDSVRIWSRPLSSLEVNESAERLFDD